MRSAFLIDSQAIGLQPLTCDVTMAFVYPEIAFADASVALSGEIYCHGFTVLIDCNSDLPQDYPDTCGVVETKAKSAAAWSECIDEWNIRGP